MRCLQRAEDVLAGAGAGVDGAFSSQFLESRAIESLPLALRIWAVRTSAIRPFLPFEPEPAQILEHSGEKLHLTATAIQILIAQDQSSLCRQRPLLRRPKSAGMAEMQQASG